MKIVALAGGVGGAKLASGLARIIPTHELSVIVNTGDDFDHFGLRICPDLDTVCYTLAGLQNPETGWGVAGESWNSMKSVERFGGPTWFKLGDQDLGTHLERTRRIASGEPLSRITANFCHALGISARVFPMTDDRVATWVVSENDGELPFQVYFVQRQCEPKVKGFRFDGIQTCRPAPGVLEAISSADLVIICPSNPWVSIDPILAVPGIKDAVKKCLVIAVSPIIGGKTVKGPAAKMYAELGIHPSALAVAQHYRDLLSGFVIDEFDRNLANEFSGWGIILLVTKTLMVTAEDRAFLANEVVNFGKTFLRRL